MLTLVPVRDQFGARPIHHERSFFIHQFALAVNHKVTKWMKKDS